MFDQQANLNKIQDKAKLHILFLPHAIRQMSRADRMISAREVEYVIFNGEVIEDYPDDERGHSFLIVGHVNNRTIHLVCSTKEDYLAVITAYLPKIVRWDSNFKKRKK